MEGEVGGLDEEVGYVGWEMAMQMAMEGCEYEIVCS